jgi:8-oxo-dGTP pyrophosphatase MutT (NUDIX family)
VGPGTGGGDPLLIRIDHDPVSALLGEVLERHAVRAVIRDGDWLLMVHSAVAGDYKFPGGGIEPGESAHEAIIREVSEECGRTVTHVGEVLLRVVEQRKALEPGRTLRMESTYFPCTVGDEVHDQRLDDYERELAFEPSWVRIDEAIENNERVLASGRARTWVTRETRVLQSLRTAH